MIFKKPDPPGTGRLCLPADPNNKLTKGKTQEAPASGGANRGEHHAPHDEGEGHPHDQLSLHTIAHKGASTLSPNRVSRNEVSRLELDGSRQPGGGLAVPPIVGNCETSMDSSARGIHAASADGDSPDVAPTQAVDRVVGANGPHFEFADGHQSDEHGALVIGVVDRSSASTRSGTRGASRTSPAPILKV